VSAAGGYITNGADGTDVGGSRGDKGMANH